MSTSFSMSEFCEVKSPKRTDFFRSSFLPGKWWNILWAFAVVGICISRMLDSHFSNPWDCWYWRLMKHPSSKQPGFMGENPNHDYRMVGNHEKKTPWTTRLHIEGWMEVEGPLRFPFCSSNRTVSGIFREQFSSWFEVHMLESWRNFLWLISGLILAVQTKFSLPTDMV